MQGPLIPEVTVVIASHRKDHIRKCVDKFTEKIIGQLPVEVIVVADYPIDGFAASYPAVRWMYCADKSIPVKRNIGIAQGGGTIVGFIDDDCIPFDNWVDHAVRYMRDHPEHAGVAGQTIVERHEGISYPLGEFKRLETPSFRTNNIFYRKEILLKAGGFDERFFVQREDIDLAFSILELGLAIGFSPDIKVLHRYREGERWDLMKNCINRRFDPLLYKKHKKMYRKWIRTPFTPSIGLMLFTYGLLAISFWHGGEFFAIAASLVAVCSLAMGIKRNRQTRLSPIQVVLDWVSYMAAPFVLMGALVYGSIKYRKLLLF
jgi:glycosyltransferase involved in cell wall biosynthesis